MMYLSDDKDKAAIDAASALLAMQCSRIRQLERENKDLRRQVAGYKNMREIKKRLGML